MKNWRFVLPAIVLTLVLFLSACSQASPSATTAAPKVTTPQTTTAPAVSTTAAPKTTAAAPATATSPAAATTTAAKTGGNLKIACSLLMTNVGDPSKDLPLADRLYSLASVELLTARDNKDAKTIPALATAWQVSSDKTSVTFNLRKGVKFHDGTDFNAAAAKFSLDLALNGKQSAMGKVASIDAVDDYTIKINLKQFDQYILDGWVNVPIVSPTSYKTLGDQAMTHPVGTGPYKFVSFEKDVRLTLERFDGYWKGKPYLDRMSFEFIADLTTQMAALKAGNVDAIVRISEQPISELKPLNYQVAAAPTAAWGIIANSIDPKSPFSNLKVRQALSYAIDAPAIAKALSYGADSYVNQFSARPEIPGSTYNSKVAGYPFNPDKAKQLLKEAGYASGFNTKMFFLNDKWFIDMSQAIAGYMANVGVKMELDIGDPARWGKETRTAFTGLAPFYISVNPLENMAEQFYWQLGGISGDQGGRWPVATIPADYKALVQQVITVSDPAQRTAVFQQMNKMVIDDYCLATPIYVGIAGSASNPKVVHDLDTRF